MKITTPSTVKEPADWFTGDVFVDVIVDESESPRIRMNVVHFAAGAHAAWHRHANGQTLHVTEGLGYVQSRGDVVVELHPGDTHHTLAGQWHWHGAQAHRFMTHLAIWEASDDPNVPETEWANMLPQTSIRTVECGSRGLSADVWATLPRLGFESLQLASVIITDGRSLVPTLCGAASRRIDRILTQIPHRDDMRRLDDPS